ncbi:uncharacterized mitochondrial protein-like protein [Tanacetum coccineum]
MVLRVVLIKSGLVSINTARQNISKIAVLVNTARQVNTAHSKTTMNAARPMSYLSKITHSTVKKPIHKNIAFKNSNINQRVNNVRGKKFNTARPRAIVNAVKGNNFNAVKASACWVWKPKHKVLDHGNPQMDEGLIDSGCSRHMTENMSYLTDYEEIDRGYVTFRWNPKGRKITGKENSISLPLHLLHMDLFGPTFVKSLKKKMYCLVVTDDYSRFTWVFFLATKDETSGILKSFITGIENLVDHKVKVIRCDNGTEFKNREMNQFCEMKGILRQFSIARTPQQNGVAKRRNRTLIEAARTMLFDSKLPTTFWAEAVNTTCYVQNRVLVVKPHNKTPYELFHGRTPTLSFMRPFGCPVTILNTIDHLGKFNGKADEGFFVGYSLNNKAFRVFNSRTRIVEENLHIRFSESTPNAIGSGPDWIFDIDALTRTMNYELIVAGTKASDNAGQARKETEHVKDYILLPLWTADLPYSQDPKSSHDDGSKPSSDDGKKVDKDPRKDSECNDQEKEDNVNITNNVNAASINEVNVVGGKTSIELPFDPNMHALEDYIIFDFLRNDEDDECTTLKKPLFGTTSKLLELVGNPPLSTYLLDNGFQRGKIDKTLFIKRHKGDILLVQVYVDDIIFGSTKKELCFAFEKLMHEKFQMSSMGELTFFLGLQVKQKKDGIFISQDKYVAEILKKFRFTEVKTASTPMETQKPLLKDEDGEEVDVHMYRSMIGSLMYLTSSRPDIMFAVCACARYQVNPKVSHFHAVKRILVLKWSTKLGSFGIIKDYPFDLVAYLLIVIMLGASLDRKSIRRLSISWM